MIILRARKNLKLEFTERQRDILVGCIFGDGYIHNLGKIQLEHSEKQKDYIDWKYKELEEIAYGKPQRVVHKDKRNNKYYCSYRFWIRQFFRTWRNIFYSEGKKIFPNMYSENLSPLSLAVWYMDDGYLDEGRRVILSTDNFDQHSIQRIQKCFTKFFGIHLRIKQNGKVMIGTIDTRRFIQIIGPYIIPSMEYKIALTP